MSTASKFRKQVKSISHASDIIWKFSVVICTCHDDRFVSGLLVNNHVPTVIFYDEFFFCIVLSQPVIFFQADRSHSFEFITGIMIDNMVCVFVWKNAQTISLILVWSVGFEPTKRCLRRCPCPNAFHNGPEVYQVPLTTTHTVYNRKRKRSSIL